MTDTTEPAKDRLRRRVTNLADVHNKKITAAGIDRWVERLLPFDGPMLERVIERALDAENMPALTEVLARYFDEKRRGTPAPDHRPTEEQRVAADQAAVKSLLWLSYNHPHAIGIVQDGVSILARMFRCGPDDAVRIGQERYSRYTLDVWMAEQQRAGN